jgi:hypothetical protein
MPPPYQCPIDICRCFIQLLCEDTEGLGVRSSVTGHVCRCRRWRFLGTSRPASEGLAQRRSFCQKSLITRQSLSLYSGYARLTFCCQAFDTAQKDRSFRNMPSTMSRLPECTLHRVKAGPGAAVAANGNFRAVSKGLAGGIAPPPAPPPRP